MKFTKTQLLKIIEEEIVNERCQKGYKTHPTRKTKVMFGRRYRNCVKAESVELDEATQGEMAMEELNKAIHAGLLDKGKDNDLYDALIKAADVVEDELARVLKDIYPGSGKPSLNIQPIRYRILQFDVFTPDHVEFNIEAIPNRGGDATVYNLKVEFPFGDDQLEDEKYDAIKKLRGGHGNIKSIKGVLNLIKQGGSLYKSQTGSLAAEPEAQAQLPFGESKMKKITKSKLNTIIKEEIEKVLKENLATAEGRTKMMVAFLKKQGIKLGDEAVKNIMKLADPKRGLYNKVNDPKITFFQQLTKMGLMGQGKEMKAMQAYEDYAEEARDEQESFDSGGYGSGF